MPTDINQKKISKIEKELKQMREKSDKEHEDALSALQLDLSSTKSLQKKNRKSKG